MSYRNPRLAFRIFYADDSFRQGRTVSDWKEFPAADVVAVQEIFEKAIERKMPRHTVQAHIGHDYYWMTPDEFIDGGAARLIPADAYVKEGIEVSDKLYMKIANQASTAPTYGSIA